MTVEQHTASDPSLSAWVSASAGTGKTKVLTDRVLRLLLAGSPPSGILCITYTKAAAAEMEERIDEKLGAWAVADEAALKEELKALTGVPADAATLKRARQLFSQVLDAAERIRIQTIHGFCQSVLMRFPLEAGVAPNFTLIEEQTAQELLGEARLRMFTNSDVRVTQALTALVPLISEDGLDELMKNIVRHRQKFLTVFEGGNLKVRLSAALNIAEGETPESLAAAYFRYTDEEEAALKAACAALMESDSVNDVQTRDHLSAWLAERNDPEAYYPAFLTQKGDMRKVVCTKAIGQRWPWLQPVLLTEQSRVYAFATALKSLRVAEASTGIAVIAECLLALYRQEKALHNYMDYDDIIHYAVRLLESEGAAAWVLYKLDGGIDHLLLDEAQDTSPEQWRLVKALTAEFFAGDGARSRQRTLFVVGDEKQSIFSFQGARPEEFDAMQLLLSKRITDARKAFQRIRLDRSFRSTAPVLASVDAVFALEEARKGLIFTEGVIAHVAHREHMAGRVELWPLVEAPPREAEPAWHVEDAQRSQPSPERLCADSIAAEIGQWLKEKRQLSARGRAVNPGDIMILVQRRGKFNGAMLRALKRRGIPVAGADRLTLAEDIAVMDCLALADFLLLPQDDLTLATVLKSPLVGLREEDIFTLAHNRGEATLWQRLRENETFAEAYGFLSDVLSKVDYLRPYEIFAYVLETCGGRRKLLERLGEEILDPLEEFLAFTLRYDQTQPPSMQGFLHWFRSSAAEIKRDMEKSTQMVRILTVHAAKGLQAPIVFLPDTTRLPRSDAGLLWQGELPLWSPYTDFDDLNYRALREASRESAHHEYRRLLYVAMTRAEDELYICGWKGAKAVSAGCWYDFMSQASAGWATEGERRVLVSPQGKPVEQAFKEDKAQASGSLPAWALTKAKPVPTDSRPLAPSRIEETRGVLSPVKENLARERGLMIHRMLQYLPDLPLEERVAAAERFTRHYGERFAPAELARIQSEVLSILTNPDFAPVFAQNSVAEAPVSGRVSAGAEGEMNISGQIDRLAVTQDAVYIIDYKTNREVPATVAEVPRGYLRQMEAYRRLISQVYPDKTVHCALLWTSAPRLMVLPEAAFAALAA